MRWLKRLFLIGICCLFFIIGLFFHADNNAEVALNRFGVVFSPIGLGLLLIAFFFAGGLTGFAVSLLPYFNARKQVLLLNRKLAGCEKEIAQLRTAPLRT